MAKKRITWTFQPADDVVSLVSKASNRVKRAARKRGEELTDRGIRTMLLNESVRLSHANLKGKRESAT